MIIFSWVPSAGPPQGLMFPVIEDPQYEYKNTITEHAVEEGANISDHVRRELVRVSFNATISNTPVIDYEGRGTVRTGQSVILPPVNVSPPLNPYAALSSVLRSSPSSVTVVSQTYPEAFDAVREVSATLEELRDSAQMLEVLSRLGLFENMQIESFTVMPVKHWATVQMHLRKIRIVNSQLVTAPKPSIPEAKKSKSKGAKDGKDAGGKKDSVLSVMKHEGLSGLTKRLGFGG